MLWQGSRRGIGRIAGIREDRHGTKHRMEKAEDVEETLSILVCKTTLLTANVPGGSRGGSRHGLKRMEGEGAAVE